jgi:hypothetical protein
MSRCLNYEVSSVHSHDITTGMEMRCKCKSCLIFNISDSVRYQRLTKDYPYTLVTVILAIDFRFGPVRMFVIVFFVSTTIIRFLGEA